MDAAEAERGTSPTRSAQEVLRRMSLNSPPSRADNPRQVKRAKVGADKDEAGRSCSRGWCCRCHACAWVYLLLMSARARSRKLPMGSFSCTHPQFFGIVFFAWCRCGRCELNARRPAPRPRRVDFVCCAKIQPHLARRHLLVNPKRLPRVRARGSFVNFFHLPLIGEADFHPLQLKPTRGGHASGGERELPLKIVDSIYTSRAFRTC